MTALISSLGAAHKRVREAALAACSAARALEDAASGVQYNPKELSAFCATALDTVAVQRAKVIMDRDTGRSKGFARVADFSSRAN